MERLCQLSGHLETTTTATSINTGLNSSSSSSSFQQPIIVIIQIEYEKWTQKAMNLFQKLYWEFLEKKKLMAGS